jgi:uncharacterized NAD(P)/FAD-binding protein YdhS
MSVDMRKGPSVAIIGAGFSGSLMALHLLRGGPPDLRVLLIERRGGFGPGLAYGACGPEHLLNVRVGNMSAFPDDPGHLAGWLCRGGRAVHPSTFITRETYGRYVTDLILQTVGAADGANRLLLAYDEAVSVARAPAGLTVQLAMGNAHEVDAVVIAAGNAPPNPLPDVGLEQLPGGIYADDPWAAAVGKCLDPAAPVLLLGTGLTMIDMAVSLGAANHQGPIVAISRRGLTPQVHGRFAQLPAAGPEPPSMRLSQMVHWVRQRAAEVGWYEAVDALRPVTHAIWTRADLATRRRFLRHLRPWWDVHRHRVAPATAELIGEMRSSGRLKVLAGRITQTSAEDEGARIAWRPRGGVAVESFHVTRIINCTGPGAARSEASDPLFRDLLQRGLARIDPMGLGLEVDGQCQLIGRDSRPDPLLYAVGPITRGSFWETVAVPDIRNQVAAVAARLVERLACRSERGDLRPAPVPDAKRRSRDRPG